MSWDKVTDPTIKDEKKGPPDWLEVRRGARKISYRVNYRREGVKLRATVEGDFGDDWKKAKLAGERMIALARLEGTPDDPNLVRCEDLCNELIEISKSKAKKTEEQTTGTMRLHLIPWLNKYCSYARDLNGTVWLNYRSFKRRENPRVTLKVHYEQFGKLCRYAHEKGIIKQRPKLDYNREKDDFKEDGMIISNEALLDMLRASPDQKKYETTGRLIATYHVELEYFRAWRDRIILQRATGMRPGEVRLLRKDRVKFFTKEVKGGMFETYAVIYLKKEDTKTRRARPVPVKHQLALAVLQTRLEGESPFFFPGKGTPNQAMGNSLKGWHAILKRAKVDKRFTPHDLRHTYLTEMFKSSSQPALICFNCGLSLEEAQKTYLHFTDEDAIAVAHDAAKKLGFIRSLKAIEGGHLEKV